MPKQVFSLFYGFRNKNEFFTAKIVFFSDYMSFGVNISEQPYTYFSKQPRMNAKFSAVPHKPTTKVCLSLLNKKRPL